MFSFFLFREEDCMKMRKGRKMEEFKVIDNCLMVKLPEEIDHHRSAYISENADHYIMNDQVNHVVFDFEETKFMDSSGIGIILGRYKKISHFGGNLRYQNSSFRSGYQRNHQWIRGKVLKI